MTTTATTKATAPPRRMNVADAVKGVLDVPDRILIHGVEGIGKTTFAAAFPASIIVEAEREGSARIDADRLQPENWAEILECVQSLTVDKHEHRTLVIDTGDAAEALLWEFMCRRDNKASIEDYGYGKGYVAALNEWRVFLGALERLRRERRMGIVIVAHSFIKTFKNPEGDDFDRYELKMHAKAAGLLKEWCDAVLFAHYETYAVKADEKKAAKGISTGARVIHTQRTAAWDAKNRYSLPPMLPLDYAVFAAAVTRRQVADPATLRASIAAKLEQLGDETMSAKVIALVDQAKDDAEALAKIDNRMTATLSSRKGS